MSSSSRISLDSHVAGRWDTNAQGWCEGVRQGWDRLREHVHDPAFFELLGDVRGLTVLDAGCGEGIVSRELARAGARVTGLDLSPAMVELARESERAESLGIAYLVGSFASMPEVADQSVDRIVSVMALMDAADLSGSLAEFHRVLRPGGAVVLSVTHPIRDRPDVKWDESRGAAQLRIGGYFALEPWEDEWAFADEGEPAPRFVIPTFPRTVSGYVNAIIDSGLSLVRIAEPAPSEAASAAGEDWLARWRAAPFCLMMRASRAG